MAVIINQSKTSFSSLKVRGPPELDVDNYYTK